MRRLLAALALALTAAAPAAAQDLKHPEDLKRLEELERKLEEQRRELDELKRNPVLPPESKLPAAEEKPPTSFRWGYDGGFFVGGTVLGVPVELRPRVRIQLDYRAFPHAGRNAVTPHPFPEEQFVLRRARVGFEGTFGVFGFFLEADPQRSQIPFGDCWLEWKQFEAVRLRVGHYRAPFGAENVTDSRYLDCVERAMVEGSGSAVAPNYRPGAMVYGSIREGILSYYVSASNRLDSNNVTSGDPLVTVRLQSEARGLVLGASARFSRVSPAVPGFSGRTPGQFEFFAPVNIRGWEQGYEVDASYYAGPVWAVGQFVWAQQERERIGADGTDGAPLITQGASLTVGWLFWGPTDPGPHGIPFKGWDLFSMDLKKKRNARTVGAELVCRLEWIDIRDARGGRRFSNGALTDSTPGTAPNSVIVRGNQAEALTVGLNLNLIENVRLMVDYVRVRTGDQARAERPHSRFQDEILIRAQLEF